MSETPSGGNLAVEPPLTLDDPQSAAWDADCELLVVGLGAAGAAAAISACEAGVDVRILDRFDHGGATAKSGGVIYAGGGTPQQIKAGYRDTPEAMYNYLRLEVGDAVGETTLRRFCEDSRDLIEWLESMGASFASDVPPPKTSYPKDGCYLYFSGNEKAAPFAQAAEPAPRGHRTYDKGLSGKRLFGHLRSRVDALGIPVTRAAVRRLITDAGGAVFGAEAWQIPPDSAAARKHRRLIGLAEALHNVAPAAADRLRAKALALEHAAAKPLRIRARRGVALTTGGFIFNRAMVAEHAPAYTATMRIGTTGCDGSGIRLGQSVGGATDRLHKISAWRFINPPQVWTHGMVVDAQGQRFCNEAAYGARLGVAMCEEHDGRAWLLLDAKMRRAAFKQALFGGLWAFQSIPAVLLMVRAKRARTIAELARRLDIPEEPLITTVHRYNSAARGESEDPLQKGTPDLQPLDTPPYYAVDISATNPMFPCPTITLGGLRVDETDGAVLDADNQPILGLYAAGRAAVGIASNNYVSGLSLADCLWSGRRIGETLGTRHRQPDTADTAA